MTTLLGVLALLTFVLALVGHVLLVRALAPRSARGRLVLGALFPPLAVLDGLAGRARREATIVAAVIVAHALVVLISALVR